MMEKVETTSDQLLIRGITLCTTWSAVIFFVNAEWFHKCVMPRRRNDCFPPAVHFFSLKVWVVSIFKHNRCALGWGFGLCALQDQEKGSWAGFARGGRADCHHDLANRSVELNRSKKEKRENEKKGSLKLKGGQGWCQFFSLPSCPPPPPTSPFPHFEKREDQGLMLCNMLNAHTEGSSTLTQTGLHFSIFSV